MPNWCENSLDSSISLEKYINKDEEFDFDLIKPMPKILRELPSIGFNKRRVEELREKGDIVKYNDYHIYKVTKKLTGSEDWYEWSVKNWGTKWNADTYFISEDKKCVSFVTAWGPPLGVIDELIRLHPKEYFLLEYAEPGTGFSGRVEYNGDGNPIHEDYDDIREGPGREITIKFFGEEFFEEE